MSNGVALHYVEQGTGTPVIFVHGSLGDYTYWKEQIGTLAKHFRVVDYSRRYNWPNENKAVPNYSAETDAISRCFRRCDRQSVSTQAKNVMHVYEVDRASCDDRLKSTIAWCRQLAVGNFPKSSSEIFARRVNQRIKCGVINRTYRLSYINGGRPSEKVLKKIRKRFWSTTADRKFYNYIAKF